MVGVGSPSWTRFELLRIVRRQQFGWLSNRFKRLRMRDLRCAFGLLCYHVHRLNQPGPNLAQGQT